MSLLIGEHIVTKIAANSTAHNEFGRRVYPCCMQLQIPKFPYIVYRSSITGNDPTKDGNCNDTVTSQIDVVEKNYTKAIDLAHEVRYSLESQKGDYSRFTVKNSLLVKTDEQYVMDMDSYVITLIFNFQTIDK